jgi:peptidoglycan-N-acetylglucosamine deacetylase
VRATFFIQGRWAEAYPKTATSVVEAGHLIGSHSFYHARMPLLSDEGLATDVSDAERAIKELLGVDPRPWFRCPFGAGSDDPRVLAGLAALGYTDIGWNVSPDDWDIPSTQQTVEDRVVDGAVAYGDGAVVLMHTWPMPTVAAMAGMVQRLRDAGATFATVDQVPRPVPSRPE